MSGINGQSPHRLTSDNSFEGEPRFSPDQKRIVYVHDYHVWMMNSDGSNQTPLTSGPNKEACPSFSSDGKYIVFEEHYSITSTSIAALRLQDRKLFHVSARFGSLARPVMNGNHDIFCVKVSDRDKFYIEKISLNKSSMSTIGSGDLITLSHDGKMIATTGDPYSQSIWLLDLRTGNARLLNNSTSYKQSLSFYPDDKHILYCESSEATGNRVSTISTVDGQSHCNFVFPW